MQPFELEALVDRIGLPGVVEMLADIADAKADHIRASYSDSVTASQWDRASARLQAQVARLHNLLDR